MNLFGVLFFLACFAGLWFSFGRLPSCVGFGGSDGAFIGASGCGGFEAGKGDSFVKGGLLSGGCSMSFT